MIKDAKVERLDFIVAGAQKCGTTALHYQLEKHPQIALPNKEELHFFDDEERFVTGVNYQDLHASFRPSSRALVAGESTPSYLYWLPAMERIWNYREDIKLIILLRNPVDRAFSHWNMQRERGYDTLDFLDAIRAEGQRQKEAAPLQSRRFSYVGRGLYGEQLERVFRYFPREQVIFVRAEDLRADFAAAFNAIFNFVGAESLRNIRNKERNPIRYAREMTAAERSQVYRLFEQDISAVEKLLDWDCSDWKL
jgi:sulfotransferase family protein